MLSSLYTQSRHSNTFQCKNCNDGDEQYCSKGSIMTYNGIDKDGSITYGGWVRGRGSWVWRHLSILLHALTDLMHVKGRNNTLSHLLFHLTIGTQLTSWWTRSLCFLSLTTSPWRGQPPSCVRESQWVHLFWLKERKGCSDVVVRDSGSQSNQWIAKLLSLMLLSAFHPSLIVNKLNRS